MKITTDETAWFNARMDTPIYPPASSFARLAMQPGTCVKSNTVKVVENQLFDCTCGVVQSNEPFKCVVVGHGLIDNLENKFVWTGTQGEFQETWRVD